VTSPSSIETSSAGVARGDSFASTVPSRTIVERWRSGDEVRQGRGAFRPHADPTGVRRPLLRSRIDVEEIDVVVPVYNDVATLDTLLTELRGFHVTVVDDGSFDGVVIAGCARRHDAALVRLAVNEGPAAARNAAALATTRPFCGSSTMTSPWATPEPSPNVSSSNFGDPLVAAVAPRVRGRGRVHLARPV
jgi:hypothetical protein